MAPRAAGPPFAPSAEVVGNAFVEQYYKILHHSPEIVYKFYNDCSVLSRPDDNGVMTSVTTMEVSSVSQSTSLFEFLKYICMSCFFFCSLQLYLLWPLLLFSDCI